ncbi:MAG: glycosyltransferase [Lachnospiraceae bacterium]|nr:glycosyltransferase [Lachnospiraceae bacterium]
MNKISVIVPAYNIEKYLPRCLDSIIAQTYENLEIILVDDGSTDNTPKICDEYASKDSRITVIHQENKGLSGARNSALKIVMGDYIGYVDGDDYIDPSMYELMLKAMEENDADLSVCGYEQVGEDARKVEFSGETYILSKEEALDAYIQDNRSFHIYNSVWSKLFKKELIDGVTFPVGRNSEDIMYTGRALSHCSKCVFVDKPLYFYILDRAGSIMNTKNASRETLSKFANRRFNDEIPFWKEQILLFKKEGLIEQSILAEYHFYKRMLFYYIDFRNRGMKEEAKRLSKNILSEKNNIALVYENDFVKRGDRARMKLFLKSPSLYYRTVSIYEKTIIPLRNK